MHDDGDERIALFLDYENLAIGARDNLGVRPFDFGPIARAMAERGRVLARRAYADWSFFDEDRRHLTRHHVELIEIPQRMGASRKNAADIKLAVDAMEMAFERQYITTYVICTGDSDLTPLVHKLRELDKRVIGIGVRQSTSKMLPPACDEFLFYDHLEGVPERAPVAPRSAAQAPTAPTAPTAATGVATSEAEDLPDDVAEAPGTEPADLDERVLSTLSGLKSSSDTVRASTLKRAMQRIDPTFREADYGFRGFTELLRNLEGRGVIELTGPTRDPEVDLVTDEGPAAAAFALLVAAVAELDDGTGVPMSGLKTELRKRDGQFSERKVGFTSFRQFCAAAAARDLITHSWSEDRGDYLVGAHTSARNGG